MLTKFSETLSDEDRKSKDKVETLLRKFCKKVKGKDERFVSDLLVYVSFVFYIVSMDSFCIF